MENGRIWSLFFLKTTQMDLNQLVKHSGGVYTRIYVISTSYLAKNQPCMTELLQVDFFNKNWSIEANFRGKNLSVKKLFF